MDLMHSKSQVSNIYRQLVDDLHQIKEKIVFDADD